ncbi:uncharacterized protein LOC135841422 isoform X2 [Planococcus citri]|uniref:uncharacterized protein LOC135841422 isoform X2 n=1 Tax=Planococcus citri TaxID=170843 RepID=UPI0031F9325E
MDRRANVKWIYVIGVVLIITNAASGVSGDKSDNSPLGRLGTDDPQSGWSCECCRLWRDQCKCSCNIVKTRNYEYDRVFPIAKGKDGTVQLKFKVKGNRDANLLFSQEAFTKDGDPAHEIVLSATSGDNITRSWLRNKKNLETGRVETFLEEASVSPNEWREYWVRIKHNRVEVGRHGKSAFLVSTSSSSNLPIRYYSVAGYLNASLLWSLPCMGEPDFH